MTADWCMPGILHQNQLMRFFLSHSRGMTIEGYVPMSTEERDAAMDLAPSRPAAKQWLQSHRAHEPYISRVENYLYRGVYVTFRCSCGETIDVMI